MIEYVQVEGPRRCGFFCFLWKIVKQFLIFFITLALLMMTNVIEVQINPEEEWQLLPTTVVEESFGIIDTTEAKIKVK